MSPEESLQELTDYTLKQDERWTECAKDAIIFLLSLTGRPASRAARTHQEMRLANSYLNFISNWIAEQVCMSTCGVAADLCAASHNPATYGDLTTTNMLSISQPTGASRQRIWEAGDGMGALWRTYSGVTDKQTRRGKAADRVTKWKYYSHVFTCGSFQR